MKLFFFSDTHLGFDFPLRPRLNIRRRGEDFFRNTENILKQAVAENADLIIHGGDLFFRSKIPAPIIDRVYELLFRYAEFGIPIIIVPGNHERSVLPQSILLHHPNLYVFSEPNTFTLQIKGQTVNISGFPNIRHNSRNLFPEVQKQFIPQKDCLNLLLMHQAIDGCRVVGYTFRDKPDVIAAKDIDQDFQLVLSGHIHRRQIIKNGQQIIIYPGSVERTSFQEMLEPKGFYIIEYSERVPFILPKIRFCELPSRPMIDLYIDGWISDVDWEAKLRIILGKLPQDAIVRLKSRIMLSDGLKTRLKAETLRSIFPEEMNYTISRSVYRDSRR